MAARRSHHWLTYAGLNVRTDRRHDRRALSADELRWLLDATVKGSEHYDMTGEARSLLYRLAVETGLRAGELRSLTPSSFRLEDREPSVTIAAAYAKNRREDVLPLRPATVAVLKVHFAERCRMPRHSTCHQKQPCPKCSGEIWIMHAKIGSNQPRRTRIA